MFYVNAKLLKQFGKRFRDGQTLFKEGDAGDCMFVIHRGKVKITKLVDGRPQLLGVMSDGQFFGEMAILNRDARSATAVCISDCEVLEIPSAGFELLMSKSPEIALQLIQAFSDRLRNTNKMLNVLFHQDDYSRVIMTLQNISDLKISEGNKLVRIPLEPQVLASQLNMTDVRVNKVLEDLVKGEVVKREEGSMRVEKPRYLAFFLRYMHERSRLRKVA